MRRNTIPTTTRLERRIQKLQSKIDPETVSIGGTNPYYKCVGCGKSVPGISVDGHFKGCAVVGIQNEIKYYQKLLEEQTNEK